MKIQNQNNSINFTAIPRGLYTLKGSQNAVVYELEKYDIDFLKTWKYNLPQFIGKNNICGDAKVEILEKGINASIVFY